MAQSFYFDTGFKEINFFNFGYERCHAHHRYQTVWSHYIIHFIVSGKGQFNDKRLEEGDYFLQKPGDDFPYQADGDNPWSYYWLSFQGQSVEKILDYLQINQSGQYQQSAMLRQQFISCLEAPYFDTSLKLQWQANFLSLLNAAFISVKVHYHPLTLSFQNYVQKHYNDCDLSIFRIAESLHISQSYLSTIIKADLALSPLAYVHQIRMEQAEFLLLKSNKTVTQIAYDVGYKDSSVFSKKFKEAYNLSPMQWKKVKSTIKS